MSLKAYKAGMPCPPVAPGKLRIYSMRFCPFCHRALLVIHAKNIDHEVVNINLKDKPEWHFKLNPAGKVPILQQDDKLVCESLIVSEYLDDAYGKAKLLPADPYLKAREKMFIEVGSAALMPVLKIHYNKDNRVELWKEFKEKVRAYEEELSARKTLYISGDKPGFADYMVWPFFPRVQAFATIFPELKPPTAEEFPCLHKWIEAMKKDKAVAATLNEQHLLEHTKSVLDNNVNYDVGL
uniref:Omega class glutathione S-transferase protein 1 n=1 Tax=Dermacentor marginatus TaxID=49202 RepID=A0A7L6N6Z7_DERMR|nr:Omega class glutathione S-transferase protein 1 [Dermacentor marginatus]